MDLRFTDHSQFHRAAAGMVGSAIGFSLALHPITPLAPLVGGVLGIGLGAAFAYGKSWRMIFAVLATLPLFLMSPTWASLVASASIASLGIALGGPRGMRGLAGMALGIATTVVAMWVAVRIGHAQRTMAWPTWITDAVAAAAMGIVGVLATLPRHFSMAVDPVSAAKRALPSVLDAEVRDLCNRASAIWTTAKERLDAQDQALVREGVLKAFEVASKSNAVKLSGSGDSELVARMAELDKRIAAATDDEVKTQYQSARAALDDQQKYRDRIRQGRERLVARMHNHVAALEKYQLAATGLEASRVEGAPAMKQLEELSKDVAASSEALAEVELPAATVAAASN